MIIFQNWTNSQRAQRARSPQPLRKIPPNSTTDEENLNESQEFDKRTSKPQSVWYRTYGDPSSGKTFDDNVGKP